MHISDGGQAEFLELHALRSSKRFCRRSMAASLDELMARRLRSHRGAFRVGGQGEGPSDSEYDSDDWGKLKNKYPYYQ